MNNINKKIKLAFCCDVPLFPGGGGMEIVLSNVLSKINLNLFDVSLLLVTPKIHEKYLEIIPKNIHIIPLIPQIFGCYSPLWRFRSPSFIFRPLAKFIMNYRLKKVFNDFDVVLDYEPYIFVRFLKRHKVKTFANVLTYHHTSIDSLQRMINSLEKNIINRMIFVNKYILQQLESETRLKQLNLTTVYNGMLFDDILTKSKHFIDARYRKVLTSKYILMTARLSKPKDHETLIKAFAKVHLNFPEYNLVFCGSGEKEFELVKLIDNLYIKNNVFFLGNVVNPYPWMKFCQVFVLSSYSEGLPVVVNEAMLLNKPIIVSDIPPCMEAINYGKCGFSFLTGDVDALALQIEKVINKDYNEQELIRNQNEFIKQFDINITVKQLEKIILDIVHEKN